MGTELWSPRSSVRPGAPPGGPGRPPGPRSTSAVRPGFGSSRGDPARGRQLLEVDRPLQDVRSDGPPTPPRTGSPRSGPRPGPRRRRVVRRGREPPGVPRRGSRSPYRSPANARSTLDHGPSASSSPASSSARANSSTPPRGSLVVGQPSQPAEGVRSLVAGGRGRRGPRGKRTSVRAGSPATKSHSPPEWPARAARRRPPPASARGPVPRAAPPHRAPRGERAVGGPVELVGHRRNRAGRRRGGVPNAFLPDRPATRATRALDVLAGLPV
jgi:hypothetical protein